MPKANREQIRAPGGASILHRDALAAAVSRRLDWLTYTSRHGLVKGMKRKGGLGFLPEWLAGSEETAEERFFRGLDLKGKVVYDVGAFQGLTAMFFSQSAKMVIAFEPNPLNCAKAFQNILANRLGNVFVLNAAAAEERGELSFVYEDNMAGRGSADHVIATHTAEKVRSSKRITVVSVTLDGVVNAGFPAPDFVKIDVEGMELSVLKGAAEILQSKPALYVEIHGATVAEKENSVSGVVHFLSGRGYDTFLHVETDAPVTPRYTAHAREGHLYCQQLGSASGPSFPAAGRKQGGPR